MTAPVGAISTMPMVSAVTGQELIPVVYAGVPQNYTITPVLLQTYLNTVAITPISGGGTGSSTAAGARSALGAAASGANSDITSITGLSTPLAANQGGTGVTSLGSLRTAISAAASGANSDITSLSALSTPLSVAQGGTNANTAAAARLSLIAAASGSNSDITSLSALSTPLSVGQGGTASTTASGARTNLSAAATTTAISAGTGLSGGGDLSANRTLALASAAANTLKGNNTGGSAVPTDLTVAQVLALLGVDVVPQGRLTLTSLTPVLTSAVNAATTVYYTPYGGNLAPIWNSTNIVPTSFTELSQALSDTTKSPSAAAASQVYDMFMWNDAGTIRCTRGPTWASGTGGSNTVRGTGAGGTALSLVNGLYFNAAAITNGPGAGLGTYVGTIATDSGGGTVSWSLGSSAAGGGAATLNVWNMYNRVSSSAWVNDSTASHTYVSATIRPFDNNTSNRITLVRGLDEDGMQATLNSRLTSVASSGNCGIIIGLDSTTAGASVSNTASVLAPSTTVSNGTNVTSNFNGLPGLGSHFLQALEFSDGTNANAFLGGTSQGLGSLFRY